MVALRLANGLIVDSNPSDRSAAEAVGDTVTDGIRTDTADRPSTESLVTEEDPSLHRQGETMRVVGDPAPLQQRITRSEPLNWLFIGDSLEPPFSADDIHCGFVGQCRRVLDGKPQRGRDTVRNRTHPRVRILDYLTNYDATVSRFLPEVLVVMCGHSETEAASWRCDEFESQLRTLIVRARSDGALVLVNTPPLRPDRNDDDNINHMVYLEAIRACCAEQDVSLVDHWEDWEQARAQNRGLATWYRMDGLHPNDLGFARMVERFTQECGLVPISV